MIMQNYSVMNTQTLNKMSWKFYRGDGSYSRLAAGGAKVKQASKVALNAALHSDLVKHAGQTGRSAHTIPGLSKLH